MSLKRLLEDSFDELITTGSIKREVKLSEKTTVTLTPLTEDQLLSTKMSIPQRAKEDILTYSNMESLEMICRAIVEVNGVPVIQAAKEEIESSKELKDEGVSAEMLAYRSIRSMLLKLPPRLLNYLSEEYNNVVREQSDLIKQGLGEGIENF